MKEEQLFRKIMGRHLKKYRNFNGTTQFELSEDIDADEKSIGKNEQGKKLPTSYTLYKLHHSIGFSVDQLFKDIKLELDSTKQEQNKEDLD